MFKEDIFCDHTLISIDQSRFGTEIKPDIKDLCVNKQVENINNTNSKKKSWQYYDNNI